MSWTYSGNPADNEVDKCRFTIGDTDASSPVMQDEEIQYIIDTYGSNENQLFYHLFNRAATLFSREIKRSLGPQSEDPTSRLDYFTKQADYYKKMASSAGLPASRYNYPKVFRKGMHSNPPWPAGRE